jgi:hypothetical protein
MREGEIKIALNQITPISLDAISCVRLMNRIEIKYVFAATRLTDIIALLADQYAVLEIDNLRVFPYSTTYFDTPEHLFYYQHLRGGFNRQKVRYRRYEATNNSFLEIKKKNNKGRTIKCRIENEPHFGSFDDSAMRFINEHLPLDSRVLSPSLINRFSRITFAGCEMKERITIDFNVSFANPENKLQLDMPYLAIVEFKKEAQSDTSRFKNMIKQLSIYPTGFSKYCVGSAITNASLRKNLIKPKLLLLNKIENEYTRSDNS